MKDKLNEEYKLRMSKKSKKESILKRADDVVNHRSEEKERMYGPFSEGMQRAAKIASGMTGKDSYFCSSLHTFTKRTVHSFFFF